MYLGRNETTKTASGIAQTQSMVLTGVAGRLAVVLTLAALLWLGTIWAVGNVFGRALARPQD